jgi:hypothetical protein
MLDEHAHDVETLIYLAVGIDQVRVMDSENIVYIEVYFKPGFFLCELKNWYSLGWDKD